MLQRSNRVRPDKCFSNEEKRVSPPRRIFILLFCLPWLVYFLCAGRGKQPRIKLGSGKLFSNEGKRYEKYKNPCEYQR
uniref:Uncharacterized protein n=1 Tax=Setaria viridis TaxID=4556 RepID=A0A4U6UFY9_SETVI|nr:hypothetical protein SEVIR_5G153800v2 [Setaria viridis]